jgi:hypothetical protein
MAADRIARRRAARVMAAGIGLRATALLRRLSAGLLSDVLLTALLGMPAALAQPAPGPIDTSRIDTVSKRPSVAVKSITATHAWHDGTAIRMLTLDPTIEAYFAAGLLPQDRVPRPEGSVLRPAGSTDRDAAAQVSPVLRDESGRPRSLPGGVVVVLKTPMDETSARALISQTGAVPLQALSDRLWLVQGPVGLGSLRLANQLQAGGRFESAQPNWWMPRTLK